MVGVAGREVGGGLLRGVERAVQQAGCGRGGVEPVAGARGRRLRVTAVVAPVGRDAAAPVDLRLLPKLAGIEVLAIVFGRDADAGHDVAVVCGAADRIDDRLPVRQEACLPRDAIGLV